MDDPEQLMNPLTFREKMHTAKLNLRVFNNSERREKKRRRCVRRQ